MKLTFPHMGNLHIVVRALLETLGVEVVVPPLSSKRTLSLGTLHAPEFACLPMKVNLGNFIEAHEIGADTIVMAGGIGPCRFGYYAQVQQEILQDLGCNMDMVVLEPPEKHISELVIRIKKVTGQNSWLQVMKALRFAWAKAKGIDAVEKMVHVVRPREYQKGVSSKVYDQFLREIDQASSYKAVERVIQQTLDDLNDVPADWRRPCVKVGLVGEIYVLLEPFINLEIERHLGEMGVEITRSIYLSEWINEHLFMNLLGSVKTGHDARKAAKPYLNHFIGGHGQDTVGHTVQYAKAGYQGVIQLAPFTCMPEIVAESILPQVRNDFNIPTLSLVIDEHAGEAGVITRLEAFVDLLSRQMSLAKSGGI